MPTIGDVFFGIIEGHSESIDREVHVRRTNRHPVGCVWCSGSRSLDFPAVLKVHTKVFNLLRGTFQSKNSCHVLGGEIGFQPSCLVRNNGVPRGVALVEAISRKLVDQLKELFSFFFGQPFFCGPFDKLHTIRIDDVFLFLTDGFDQRVRTPKRNASQVVHDLHHLLLVDHDPVRLLGELIDNRMHFRHRSFAMLPFAIVGNQVHRTRSEEGVGRNQIFQAVWTHVF